MRFDKKVTFKSVSTAYSSETGKSVTTETTLATHNCHVITMNARERAELFGRVDQEGYTVVHRGGLVDADIVEIDGIDYNVTMHRQAMKKATYKVSRVKL